MRAILIAALCTSVAYAKPQYSYPAPSIPSSGYGAPSGVSRGQAAASGVGDNLLTQTETSDDKTGGGGTQSFTGLLGPEFRQKQGTGRGVSSSGISGSGAGTLIHKHIYVYVAQPEPEEVRPQRPISVGQATKHYKIIFIKAPSYQTYQQQIVQQQAQNEEKTLVYVLVKKPDEQPDITIPTAAPTAPSKPEVYFIKYKAKSELAGGGAGGQSQLSGGGIGVSGSSLSSASRASSQFNSASSLGLSTGDYSSSVSVARPQTNYGPPGLSGPY